MVRRDLMAAAWVLGLVACSPHAFLAYEASEQDWVFVVEVDDEGQPIDVAEMPAGGVEQRERDPEHGLVVLVIPAASLIDEHQALLTPESGLLIRSTASPESFVSCARCPEPAFDGPQVFGPGDACSIPPSAKLFGEGVDSQKVLRGLQAVRPLGAEQCRCVDPGLDERSLGLRPVFPEDTLMPIERVDAFGDLVVFGGRSIVGVVSDSGVEIVSEPEMLEADIAGVGPPVRRSGSWEVPLVLSLPLEISGGRSSEVVNFRFDTRQVTTLHQFPADDVDLALWSQDGSSVLLEGTRDGRPTVEVCKPDFSAPCLRVFPEVLPSWLSVGGGIARAGSRWVYVSSSATFLYDDFPAPDPSLQVIVTPEESWGQSGIVRTTAKDIPFRLVRHPRVEETVDVDPTGIAFTGNGWFYCLAELREGASRVFAAVDPRDYVSPMTFREIAYIPGIECRYTKVSGERIWYGSATGDYFSCDPRGCTTLNGESPVQTRDILWSPVRELAFDARSVLTSTASGWSYLAGTQEPIDSIVSLQVRNGRFLAISRTGRLTEVDATGVSRAAGKIEGPVISAAYDASEDGLFVLRRDTSKCGGGPGTGVTWFDFRTEREQPIEVPADLACVPSLEVVSADNGRFLVAAEGGLLFAARRDQMVRLTIEWDDPTTAVVEGVESPSVECGGDFNGRGFARDLFDERLWFDVSARNGWGVAVGCGHTVVRVNLTTWPPMAVRFGLNREGGEAPAHPLIAASSLECADAFALAARNVTPGSAVRGEVFRAIGTQDPPVRQGFATLALVREAGNDRRGNVGFGSREVTDLVGRASGLTLVFESNLHRVGARDGARMRSTRLMAAAELPTGELLVGDEHGSLFLSE